MKNYFTFLVIMTVALHTHAQSIWTPFFFEINANLYAIAFSELEQGVAVGEGGVILRTDDGFTWTIIETTIDLDLRTVSHAGAETFIAAGAQGLILRSVDASLSWDIVQLATQDFDIFGLDIDPVSGNGLAGGSGNTILTTQDHGESWSFYEGGFMNAYYCACMANADFGLVIGSNAVFQSLAAYTNNGG